MKQSGRLDEQSNFVHCQLPIAYCVSLIMVKVTWHIFIYIFQTEHLLAMKYGTDYEKNMSFLVIPRSLKIWKKLKKKRTGLLNNFHNVTVLLQKVTQWNSLRWVWLFSCLLSLLGHSIYNPYTPCGRFWKLAHLTGSMNFYMHLSFVWFLD